MMRVVVTGANGFVGRALMARLGSDGHDVVGAVRSGVDGSRFRHPMFDIGADVGDRTDWSSVLDGADAVVHLVARTHRIDERGLGELDAYRAVNVGGTRSLVRDAARAGVGRVVFVSSIKVNGECTGKRPFRADDRPAPEDAYGTSKWEAEQAVWSIAHAADVEAVVVRPPLVYGPECVGNFARLRDAVRAGAPLPFGSIRNRRSLIALDNLVDVLTRCITHERAPGQTLLVSDGEDVSTPDLIERMAAAMDRRARLLAVPPFLLRGAGLLTGRQAQVRRLLDSLVVDSSDTRRLLEWVPPVTVDEGLRRAVAHD